MTTKEERLQLIREWEKHCIETGHVGARYNMSIGGSYIECVYLIKTAENNKGWNSFCKWNSEKEVTG